MGALAELHQGPSVSDYLESETRSEIRHEYFAGMITSMSGASDRHNIISLNLASAIRAHLRGGPCQTFIHDMKVRIAYSHEDVFYYPDVFVSCNPADNAPYFRREPKLIIEILSPENESKDRVEKYLVYQRIPSLEEYLLVDQEPGKERSLMLYRKTSGQISDWERPMLFHGQPLTLHSIGLTLQHEEIYEGLDRGAER